jgi:hypothetical protein
VRARNPDRDGFVSRDGVRIFYEVFGGDVAGRPAVLLAPTWSIVHSRMWKAQVPYLARHYRVITFDGRGNGRSDRPADSAAYTHLEFAADTLAVLDATATEKAVLVSFSCGTLWTVQVAAVVQGGLTTCMELTANRRPFIYVPLRHHFEQNFHVRHRLDRYKAGRHLSYDEAADPDGLAAAIAVEINRPIDYRPVATDGAARAARSIAELL